MDSPATPLQIVTYWVTGQTILVLFIMFYVRCSYRKKIKRAKRISSFKTQSQTNANPH